jgi:GNAT superfamily N-acetyltransferase
MKQSFKLPPGYTVRLKKDSEDHWGIYNLLIFRREKEPGQISGFFLIFFVLATLLFTYIVYLITQNLGVIISSLFFVILCIFILLAAFHNTKPARNRKFAMASYSGNLVGVAILEIFHGYKVLKGLYISPSHRRKRIGSYLVKYILRGISEPVYVCAMPGLSYFYNNLAFVESNERKGYNMVQKFDHNKE